jgi:hypothetical protein
MTTLDHRELSTVLGGRGGHCHQGSRRGPGAAGHGPMMGGQGSRGGRMHSMQQGGMPGGGGMQPAADQGGDRSGDSGGGAMPMTQGGASPQTSGSSGGGGQLASLVAQMGNIVQQMQSVVSG